MTILFTGPENAGATLVMAHGAGAPMDSAWMNAICKRLADLGLRTARFEFAYMAARREGRRKPPPRAEKVIEEYRAAVARLGSERKLFIGGKSMGGRVASMLAAEAHREGTVAGLICLGYPFHPPGQPEKLRTAHLTDLACPALICQGTNDPFGTKEEVAGYALSPAIELFWIEGGDHDLKAPKPDTLSTSLDRVAARVARWIATI